MSCVTLLYFKCESRQATNKVDWQPGDYRWSVNLPEGLVWIYMCKHIYFIAPQVWYFRPCKYLRSKEVTVRAVCAKACLWHADVLISSLPHCTKGTIHQVSTMLATSKNVLFPSHNHLLTTGTDDPSLTWTIIKVTGHQYWWLARCYDLEIGQF